MARGIGAQRDLETTQQGWIPEFLEPGVSIFKYDYASQPGLTQRPYYRV